MKNFKTQWCKALFNKAALLALGLALSVLTAGTAKAQYSFYSPQVLNGDSGTVENDNTGVTPDPYAPSIAGSAANAPLWYQWTASHDGDVDLDTISTNGLFYLDTVLGVYAAGGTNLLQVSQIAANDDLFPVSASFGQTNYFSDPSLAVFFGSGLVLNIFGSQPYNGPSHLRFTAQAGATYYFAVDTKASAGTGLIDLSWAYHSAGVVRFASEDFDPYSFTLSGVRMPLYQTADTESQLPNGTALDVNSTILTYYTYNAQGLLVTVTRTAGSSGRMSVQYSTTNGASIPYFSFTDVPALDVYTNIIEYVNLDGSPGTNANGTLIPWTTNVVNGAYPRVSGTLVFDDYEMSKTILIPITNTLAEASGQSLNIITIPVLNGQPMTHPDSIRTDIYNSYFGIVLSNPQPDPMESPEVSAPRVDPFFNTAVVRVLNTSADPNGPDLVPLVITNAQVAFNPTNSTFTTNYTYFTNFVVAAFPTNSIFNFEKANYRVPADVNNPTNSGWTDVAIYVQRSFLSGNTNFQAETLNYRVNSFLADNFGGDEELNYVYPLQPGSDYAVPTPPTWSAVRGTNSDFVLAAGTISFPAAPAVGAAYQKITFSVPTSSLTKFNHDFRIQLYRDIKVGNNTLPAIQGMVAETTVTILTDDQTPPAGSVDELHNADFNQDLALPPNLIPITNPQQNSNPGASGQVNGIALLTNNEALIVGDFPSYNGYGYGGVALVKFDGSPDLNFNPGTGANGFVNAVGLTPDSSEFYVGGAFTSFNGTQNEGIARLMANGSLDTAFNSGLGADGQVNALVVQPDGRVIIGGNFTHYNGTARNYVARINTDGSLDTTFDPGATINGPVYALALPPSISINITNTANGTEVENDQPVNIGAATSATLNVNFDMAAIPDDMRIFYGDTNVASGSGVLIYDTGNVSGTGSFSLPFGPTNGLTTNVITIVMDQGGGTPGTVWSYNATVTKVAASTGVVVGGDFTVSGQQYVNLARLTPAGALDTSFNPGSGPDNKVLALGWEFDNKVVVGGAFTHLNNFRYNHLARLNGDGSIDTTNFFIGSGADDVVYNITLQSLDGSMYIGGLFDSINGTHRMGFARLYANGTVDTTFMDTAYNQFAGLKKIYSYDTPAVLCSAVQTDGNVLIGGSFNQVGGGEADTNVCNVLDYELGYTPSFGDTNQYVEPKTRDGVRNRSNFARLIGGATPGPGNIQLLQTSYSVNKSQSSVFVSLLRTNGTLGPIGANFSVSPGLAQSGQDYIYDAAPPLFWIDWEYLSHPSRAKSWGLFGQAGALQDIFGLFLGRSDLFVNQLSTVNVNIINDKNKSGNQDASVQLANPTGDNTFYLGGENIPLGGALGMSQSPFTIIDDSKNSGVFGFSATNYIATNAQCLITLTRSNGNYGTVTLKYSTTNNTAFASTDYIGLTNISSVFNSGTFSNRFNVSIINNSFVYTNIIEKTFALKLTSLSGPVDGSASYGISNAVVRIINPNYQGYVTFTATNFSGTESSGFVNFVVNRSSGSKGAISVQYATTNGTAFNGVDYNGTTNILNWNDGDASSRIVSIPLINYGAVNNNKVFAVRLFNPMVGAVSTPSLMGLITNATLTIVDDNSYGSLQFNSPVYTVNEDGGYATITVVRSSGAAGAVAVHYATGDSNAVSPVNYTATNGVLYFTTNQLTASFTVAIHDDGVVDPAPQNFTFNVALSNPTNASLGALSNSLVQIVDAQSYNQPPGSPDSGFSAITSFNGSVLGLGLQSSGDIIAAGNFTSVAGVPENSLARLNPDGSLDLNFLNNLAGANGAIQALVVQTDDQILIGGAFTSFDSKHLNYIARINTDGTVDSTFNPGAGADSPVNAIAETFINGSRYIYVGGGFGNLNSVTTPGIARMDQHGNVDTGFATGSGCDGPVETIAVYATNSPFAGKVLVGGNFAHYNGAGISDFMRLNQDGSVDTNFLAKIGSGPNGLVRSILVQLDGRILVSGSFTNFNGAPVNRLVRLNSDGSVDTGFAANIGTGADGTIETLAIQSDNRILLTGQFVTFNGVSRHHVTRLMPDGTTDPTINFGDGANGDINASLIQPNNGFIVLGGGFTQYDDQAHNNIVRIYGGSITGSGSIQFTSANYQVDERGGSAVITLRRTGGTSGPNADGTGNVTVQFDTVDGTAISPVNYSAVHTTVSFPPGETIKAVNIPVFDDGVITPDLTNQLVLSNPTAPATLGAQPTASLTIINDDNAVSFASPVYSQVKNTPYGFAPIDVLRIGGTNSTVSVDFYTTTNGTAIPGLDYFPTNMTVTFLPGQADIPVLVPVINNGLIEGNKTVDMILTNPVNTVMVDPSNAVLTIVDTTPGPGRFCFTSTNYIVSESDASAQVTVLRTNGSSGIISVSYFTVSGTAVPNINYTTTSGTLTFGDGETNKVINIPLVDNNLVQGTVNFSVALTNATGNGVIITPSNTVVSVLDNDVGLNFVNGTNYVSETNTVGSILVQRVGLTNNAIQADYFTTDGTAFAGTNYVASHGTVYFAAGQRFSAITVPMIYDPKVTGNLTFSLNLTNAQPGGVQLVFPTNALVIVQDGDAGLSFTNSYTSVAKNAGSAIIPVVCSNTNVEPVSVNYSTADGSALANIHYVPVSGTLTFSNGMATNYFVVPIINNGIVDSNRTFSVSLSAPTPPGQVVAPGTQTVTILEANSGFSFTSPFYTVNRDGGAPASITVYRSGNTNTVSSVNFTANTGSAVPGLDYFPTNGVLVFTNGITAETFAVTPIGNTAVQPEKNVLLQLFTPTNGILSVPGAATLHIIDTSGSLVVPAGSVLISESFSPPNDIIDPGETVTLQMALRASGGTNVPDVKATLLATNGVTSPSGQQDYGGLTVQGPSQWRTFSFTAVGTNNQLIAATLKLSNGITNIGTAVFTYTLGTVTNVFSNNTAIVINDNQAASPYPASIVVSNVGGALIKSTVLFSNVYHTSPADIDALLVAPSQADTLLMSHAGGQNVIKAVNLLFDDAAPTSLPQNGQIVSSTNKPTAYGSIINFP